MYETSQTSQLLAAYDHVQQTLAVIVSSVHGVVSRDQIDLRNRLYAELVKRGAIETEA